MNSSERQLRVEDGSWKWPDFTIEDDMTGTTYYWEHLGTLRVPSCHPYVGALRLDIRVTLRGSSNSQRDKIGLGVSDDGVDVSGGHGDLTGLSGER
ncbi:MAG TPA: hypothetical protein VFQ44_17945 [Streptosporangiaceae bacterium]|nr:hypothetical protein [Streptosporangiaceae bacterium]